MSSLHSPRPMDTRPPSSSRDGSRSLQRRPIATSHKDRYEREADRLAQLASAQREAGRSWTYHPSPAMPLSPLARASREGATPPISEHTAGLVANPGQGLAIEPEVRNLVEPMVRRDLSTVRVHSDPSSHVAADDLAARAFTSGRHIFLGRSQSPSDARLLAHEIAHVVQQGAATSNLIQRDGSGYHEGIVTVRWADDPAEFYRRLVNATRGSRAFSGVPSSSMWQPFHGPTHRFHIRHGRRHRTDLQSGDRVPVHVAGFYSSEDVPGMSRVRIWHDEDVPARTPEPTPAPEPPPPPPPPDLRAEGRVGWNEQTPELVTVLASGVTPRVVASDFYGDEALATHVWAQWDEEERGEPFTVNTEIPIGTDVRIVRSKLREEWQSRFDLAVNTMDRDIWNARPPIVDDPDRSYEPYTGDLESVYHSIAVHHSGNDNHHTMADVQNVNMDDQGRADVAYHFGISRFGTIYEGRPIDVKGAHIAGGNTGNIGIVFLADLNEQWWDFDDELTSKMEAGLLQLVHSLRGRFPHIRFLGGHREYNSGRSCPGNLPMARMDRWRTSTGLSEPQPVN